MTVLGIGWLEILSWYLAVGVILCAGLFIKGQYTKAAPEVEADSGSWLVLTPPVKPRAMLLRLGEYVFALLVFVSIWPILIWWIVKQKWFTVRPLKPAEFAVLREHLQEVLSIESIETDAKVFDPLGAVPAVPFGHLNPAWERLKAGMQPGDEISTFVASWKSYGVMWELSGFAIVRAGKSVNFWVMGQKITKPNAPPVSAS
ncbi:MAG: hypothetical protein D4S02_16675 [Rhodocyclaceae bacterium]|nr:MAG: hypothetical protein D4S02_16675 [Rhodocyclaceae bacterium]